MREYDDITLKRLQSIELMIANDLKRICKENDIQYFGFAGTGIGVLRHQGFIPWDDDIDLGFLRDDYEKFIRIAKEELKDKYTVMNCETDPNYPLMTTRLMLKGTKFREEALKDLKCELGIFLDLYAFDQVSDNEEEFKKQCRDAWLYSHLMILRSIPFPVLPVKGIKGKIAHGATAVVYGGLSLLHVSKTWLAKKAKEAATRYNGGKKTKSVNFFFDTLPDMCVYHYDELFPLVELPFENTTFTFPKEQDRYLRTFYRGDYMQLPPEDKRKNHFPYELDFGIYKDVPLDVLRDPDFYLDPKEIQQNK